MDITSSSPQVQAWFNAEPHVGEKPVSVRLAIEGYRDAQAGVKPFMPHGKPMFILAIGDNKKSETAAQEALAELGIPVTQCRNGAITIEVTRVQLERVLETGKFRSAHLTSECVIESGAHAL